VQVFFKQFIARIDAGHDHMRIAYRYPLDNTLGKPDKIVVDGDWLEVRPSDLTGGPRSGCLRNCPALGSACARACRAAKTHQVA